MERVLVFENRKTDLSENNAFQITLYNIVEICPLMSLVVNVSIIECAHRLSI